MKTLTVMAGLLLLTLLAGCSAPSSNEELTGGSSNSTPSPEAEAEVVEEEPEPEPDEEEAEDPVIGETAFGREPESDSWWYAVIVENPNPNHTFPSAEVDVEAIGADSVILDSGSHYVTMLPTGRVALTGTFYEVGSAQVASIDVRGPIADSAVSSPAGETGSFTVGAIDVATDSYSKTVGGNVTSNFADDQELVEVAIIARAPGGQIVGGRSAYIDRLPSGGTARFESTFYEGLPDGATFEAFPHL